MYDNDEIVRMVIKDFPKLKQTLVNLESLIEMDIVKSAMIEHIKMLVVLAHKLLEEGKPIDTCYKGHMLHSVFYGEPGVGKSRTARYLAEIWKALGVLKIKEEEVSLKTYEVLSKVNSIRDHFLDLYEKYKSSSKLSWKQTNIEWELLKEELKDFGDKLSSNKNTEIKKEDQENMIIVCGRENFVAEYAGQTSAKTYNFLKDNLGKCIIIEEAYLLYNSENDNYGMEAITVLNRFMDEHADSILIIFTGYEELLQKTIFKAQPGLKRRCQWIFNLQGYTPEGLMLIFENQMNSLGWSLCKKYDWINFFTVNLSFFPNFGGDTEKLALRCKMKSTKDVFQDLLLSVGKKDKTTNINFLVTEEIVVEAFEEYKKHIF